MSAKFIYSVQQCILTVLSALIEYVKTTHKILKKTLVCRKLRPYFHVTPVTKFGKLFINNA